MTRFPSPCIVARFGPKQQVPDPDGVAVLVGHGVPQPGITQAAVPADAHPRIVQVLRRFPRCLVVERAPDNELVVASWESLDEPPRLDAEVDPARRRVAARLVQTAS